MADGSDTRSRSFTSMLLAGLVVVIAGWLLLHFLIHLAVLFATAVIVVVAVVALVWALRVLL